VKSAPVNNGVVAVAVAYHLNTGFVTPLAKAVRITEVPEQTVVPEAVIIEPADNGIIVMLTL
jgi:hypothetical protein